MDASIVKLKGKKKKIGFSSGVAKCSDLADAKKLISDVTANLRKAGYSPLVIDQVVLFPRGTTRTQVKRVLLEISKTSRKLGMVVGKGHTEIAPSVRETMLLVTIFGNA
jgi:hydrogenase maturation factor